MTRSCFLLLKVTCVIALFLILTPVVGRSESNLFFIKDRHAEDRVTHEPTPLEVFKLSDSLAALQLVQSIQANGMAFLGVAVYPRLGVVLVTQENYPLAPRLGFIGMNSPGTFQTIRLDSAAAVGQCGLRLDSTGHLQLAVTLARVNRDPYEVRQPVAPTLTKQQSSQIFGLPGKFAVPVGGFTGNWAHSSDVVHADVMADGSIRLEDSTLRLVMARVPVGVKRLEAKLGWNLIANEPGYAALLSIIDRNGLSDNEVLMYDKATSAWSSLTIPGNETHPRLVNGWLAGTVADANRETNFDTRKGLPPVDREDVIVIDPWQHHQFMTHLGKQPEVLWIDSDSTVFYRVRDSLYTAKIGNDDFASRKLVLTSRDVNYIHWAFHGTAR